MIIILEIKGKKVKVTKDNSIYVPAVEEIAKAKDLKNGHWAFLITEGETSSEFTVQYVSAAHVEDGIIHMDASGRLYLKNLLIKYGESEEFEDD